jgi:DNA-binding winged helix-turn-helix (wHTH) protein
MRVAELRPPSRFPLNTRINVARRAIDDTGQEQRLIRTLPRNGLRFNRRSRRGSNPLDCEWPDEAMAAERQGPVLIHPDRPSIAVLPFLNMSGDPEHNSFADGMTEEINTACRPRPTGRIG